MVLEATIKGKQVDTIRWFIRKLSDVKEVSMDIDFGILINCSNFSSWSWRLKWEFCEEIF